MSLVVPAYNEEDFLPRLLDSVDVALERYRNGADRIEVIVADNASTDRTGEIASSRGCRVARVEKRAIAAARNGGASIARGEVLCFVDADFRIHPETFNEIADALATEQIVAGATGVRLERWSLGLALTYVMMIGLIATLGMDTGVVFVRRRDFDAIGGYNEDRLYAEDVEFLVDLRRLGKKREPRQRLTRATRAKAVASTRKFDRYGDWHYFRMIARHLPPLLLRRRKGADEFARDYWYRDRE